MKLKHFLIASFIFTQHLLGMTNEEFSYWWNDYSRNTNIPMELKEMESNFIESKSFKYSSNFWNALNKEHIIGISKYGYDNFKQTITRQYFTWVLQHDHPYSIYLRNLIKTPLVKLPKKEMQKVHHLFTPNESYAFNSMTELFLNYLLSIGAAPQLEKLEEPTIGNPPSLVYNAKRISQDILNSLLEYLPISQKCPLDKMGRIIEVGAGSGRTAFCFISLHPNVKYVIVDIPPALYISQRYLSDVFPNKKIMHFRPFTDFIEIAREYENADIVFLMPHQLATLPDRSGDLFLAIDCLHEMKPEMVSYYFEEAERLCSYFYFKCWKDTHVPLDNVHYSFDSYPVKKEWQPHFTESCIFPYDFFHSLYSFK